MFSYSTEISTRDVKVSVTYTPPSAIAVWAESLMILGSFGACNCYVIPRTDLLMTDSPI